VGENNLKVYITEYYKKLFAAPVPNSFSLIDDNNQDISQLSQTENNILTADFSGKEVFEAISQMKHNKAPGPDEFPAEFYQKKLGCYQDRLDGIICIATSWRITIVQVELRCNYSLAQKRKCCSNTRI
jgi:hypothetical protein